MRFIINLPQEELESVERICFQVEEAQWFYEDFIRPLDPDLPSLNLRNFCLRIFQHCPLLSQFSSYHHSTAFSEFLAYKTRVPVRGAIMLNYDMDAVVLVKGWKKGANWSFPRGKINKDEPDLDCAIREVYEETGYDIHEAGLVGNDENVKFIEITMREQHMRLYVFRGVLTDTRFEPKTRKEISKIQWYKLSDLPTLKKGKNQQEGKGDDLANNANKFYMVAPFLNPLKKWIAQQKKLDRQNEDGHQHIFVPPSSQHLDAPILGPSADRTISNVDISEMERLLAGLRQSGQSSGVSQLPEKSEIMPPVAKVETPLEPLVQPAQSAMNGSMTISTASGADREKSKALLALLKGDNTNVHAQLPQTPMEQVVEHSVMPSSPKIHHARAARDRDPLDTRILNQPAAMLTRDHVKPQWVQVSGGFQKEQTSYTPAIGAVSNQPADPFRLTSNNSKLVRPHNHVVPAPYQRTHDRTVAQASQSAGLPSSIPAASKLPPPKLTSHSSSLLDLFKSTQPAKASKEAAALDPTSIRGLASDPYRPSNTERDDRSGVDNVSLAALSRVHVEHHAQISPESSTTVSEIANTVERTASALLERGPERNEPATEPPKTLSARQMEYHAMDPIVQAAVNTLHSAPSVTTNRADQPVLPRTTHQATLLDLFRGPSAPASEVAKQLKPSLEPPPTPVELSALPSPGHSREPSQVTEPLRVQPVGDLSHVLPNSQPKRTKAILAPRKSPVSATVNGPLNIPQFDMLIKKPSVKRTLLPDNSSPKARYQSPVRILSRPAQLPNPSVPMTPNGYLPDQEITPAPPNTTASTPAPPSKTVPAPLHQPQILRRPPQLQPSLHDSILSPIDPLPSPKHNFGRGKQTQDHKQTLLSLFNKPSPATTPNPMDLQALISPPPFGSASSSVFDDNRAPPETLPSAGLERSTVGSLPSVTGAEGAKVSSGRQTPRTTTTPKDRTFLLGYLEGVARAEGK